MTESVKAVVLVDGEGRFFDLRWTNEKGQRKSIENLRLWHLHSVTNRLLEYDKPHRLAGLEDRGTFLVARLEGTASTLPARGPAAAPEIAAPIEFVEPVEPGPALSIDVIGALAELIARRRLELPEGSYTSYLFKEGPAKIRKKTGEEAVEVLLATRPEELVHEAADLVYHLLVLLEAEGLGLAPLLAELATRGK